MNSPLMGLDIGLKRTGVALSENGILARPLTVLEAKPPHLTGVVRDIVALAAEHEVHTLVVGMPYTSDDAATAQSQKVEQILSQIEDASREARLPLEIVRLNEFYSTHDAAQLFPDADKDSGAAALLLQRYIDDYAD